MLSTTIQVMVNLSRWKARLIRVTRCGVSDVAATSVNATFHVGPHNVPVHLAQALTGSARSPIWAVISGIVGARHAQLTASRPSNLRSARTLIFQRVSSHRSDVRCLLNHNKDADDYIEFARTSMLAESFSIPNNTKD
jgi:hypothetical protein